jgi:hypothetical protein
MASRTVSFSSDTVHLRTTHRTPPTPRLACETFRATECQRTTAVRLPEAPQTAAEPDGAEFLIAVVSQSQRFFVPSEELYARLVEDERRQNEEPSPIRECNVLYDPKRFKLLLPNAGPAAGEVVGLWPV